tara:strand:+ start:108 stop:359 length:252 start_codon:yes stop_codon:yes gene_type:complete
MLFDNKLIIPPNAPPLTRQYGCSNLLAQNNKVLSIDTKVDFNNIILSIPNFDNLNSSNLSQIKRYNSELNQSIKSTNIKRIKT